MCADDFWPDDIGESSVVTPVSILKEQAAALGPKTKGLVTAGVVPTQSGNPQYLAYIFSLVAPAVSYRYQLLTVTHPISLYPVNAAYKGINKNLLGEIEFKAWLKEVLSSEETKRIVAALIAQSKQ
ncbi:MAG: hypothetical protein WBQ03_00905 [Candidatus Sulfotelmatobacter sp.]